MTKVHGRVDHVIWLVHPENAERYVAQLSELFDVEFEHLDGPAIAASGRGPHVANVHIYISWDSGLELGVPAAMDDPDLTPMHQRLRDYGEGFLGIVFGVADIDAALARLEQLGHSPGALIQTPDLDERTSLLNAWTTKVTDVREAFIGQNFLGVQLLLGEIHYSDEDGD